MMKLSVCVDAVFFGQDFVQSLESIRSLGITRYEMWGLRDHPLGIGAKNKNLEAIAAAALRLGMSCTACTGPFCDLTSTKNLDTFFADLKMDIAKATMIGCPTMILNAGGAIEPTDPNGSINNATRTLQDIAKIAEEAGITIALEPLNSSVDHPHSVLTHAENGFQLIKTVSSPSLKLLYDIYHQQITDGNVTETIIANLDKIVHFHAAGIPGRHELEPGELDFRYVLGKISEAGCNKIVGLEYEPTRDAIDSLKAMQKLLTGICE